MQLWTSVWSEPGIGSVGRTHAVHVPWQKQLRLPQLASNVCDLTNKCPIRTGALPSLRLLCVGHCVSMGWFGSNAQVRGIR